MPLEALPAAQAGDIEGFEREWLQKMVAWANETNLKLATRTTYDKVTQHLDFWGKVVRRGTAEQVTLTLPAVTSALEFLLASANTDETRRAVLLAGAKWLRQTTEMVAKQLSAEEIHKMLAAPLRDRIPIISAAISERGHEISRRAKTNEALPVLKDAVHRVFTVGVKLRSRRNEEA